MRLLRPTIALLALAAALGAGCGSDEEQGSPLPEQAVTDLDSRLSEVERRMEAGGGACADIIGDTLPAVNTTIQSLPEDVDPDVRQALLDGFNRLFELTGEQCDVEKGQETQPEPLLEPEPETETETTPTETETTPTETTPTETTPTTPEEPIEPLEEDPNAEEGSGGAVTPEDDG